MRISTIVLNLAIFGAAAAGSYVVANAAALWIEKSTAQEVGLELQENGFMWATAETDGLRVTLIGEAPTEADRFQAVSLAGSIIDASRVYDNLDVAALASLRAPEFSLEILRNDSGTSLIGLIPADMDRNGFVSRVQRAVGSSPVSDFLETADYDIPENWDAALDYSLYALSKLERSKIAATARRVYVVAISESEIERRNFETELVRRQPENVKVALDIGAPRPVVAPYAMRFVKDETGARFDACVADTQVVANQILNAARAAGVEGQAACELGLGAPTKTWGTAVSQSIVAIDALGGGTVTLTDTNIALQALEGTNDEVFDQITSRLDAQLPDIFTLTAVLPKPEVVDDQATPEFTATLSPEGQLQLRGVVSDDASQTSVAAFAKAKFNSDGISDASKIVDGLPSGWTIRVMAGLEALAAMESGFAEVTPDAITLKGRTGNSKVSTEISQSLVQILGQDAIFDLDVEYVKALDPLANRLTPAACVAEITTLATNTKIRFEPGSTNPDSKSRDTIDQIAAIMGRCPTAEIEISGHTDSQGREEMNQSLSQQRADAVLDALRIKRVDIQTLIAKGYGESQPIADNGTEAGREANRRIEFRLISATPVELPVEEGTSDEQN